MLALPSVPLQETSSRYRVSLELLVFGGFRAQGHLTLDNHASGHVEHFRCVSAKLHLQPWSFVCAFPGTKSKGRSTPSSPAPPTSDGHKSRPSSGEWCRKDD